MHIYNHISILIVSKIDKYTLAQLHKVKTWWAYGHMLKNAPMLAHKYSFLKCLQTRCCHQDSMLKLDLRGASIYPLYRV
jgi:hypothetical protein